MKNLLFVLLLLPSVVVSDGFYLDLSVGINYHKYTDSSNNYKYTDSLVAKADFYNGSYINQTASRPAALGAGTLGVVRVGYKYKIHNLYYEHISSIDDAHDRGVDFISYGLHFE